MIGDLPARMVRTGALGLAGMLAACSPHGDASPDGPDAFKARFVVEPAAQAPGASSAQRLILPAQALIAVQRADLGDVRVFDRRGKPLALALAGPGTGQPAAEHSVTLPAIPLIGPAPPQGAGVTIAIDDARTAHVVVDRSAAQGAGDTTVGALIDARAIAEPALAITLDAQLPLQRPVSFVIEQSTDLAHWQPLAERVLLRAGQGGALLGAARIPLGGADLSGRYLRVSWGDAGGVAVNGAVIATAPGAPLPRPAVQSRGLKLESAHQARFALGFAAPIAALRLTETAPDGVVPVKIYARSASEQPWQLLAAGIVRQGGRGSVIELGGGPCCDYRIEADQRSGGFSSPPALELQFEPVELVAAFNDAPPYLLAVGSRQAKPAWFDLNEIARTAPGDVGALPLARIDVSGAKPPAIAVGPARESPIDARKLALWGVLLLGTAILAFAVLRLLRQGGGEPG